ncbi:MAG: glycine zipper domain-containing protein [Planctomycetota bacterium]
MISSLSAQGFAPYTPAPVYPNARVGQQRGATLGGLAGAVAGGIIGDNNGEAGAGAAIGGVLGAVAGGLLGNAADRETELQSQRQTYAATQQQASIVQSAVSIDDVIQMSRSGLSDNVIMGQIQARGVVTVPNVSDIIAMHQQGVSEAVMTAMQRGTRGPTVTSPPATIARPVVPSPVIVEEHHYVPFHPVPIYRHHPYRSHTRIHFGF